MLAIVSVLEDCSEETNKIYYDPAYEYSCVKNEYFLIFLELTVYAEFFDSVSDDSDWKQQ
jgi:hypothetical protein